MSRDNVFYNRKTQPRAAQLARAVRIDAVESFGQPGNVMRLDPLALVGD